MDFKATSLLMILRNTKHMLVGNSVFKWKNVVSQYDNARDTRMLFLFK